MKKWSKVIAIVLCAICLVTASVLGTIAALTVKSETVKNAFTVGNITLTLDESAVNGNGTDRVTKNTYKLFANTTYTKDPIVHVGAGSEACYLFVVVENDILNIEDNTKSTIASQITANGWNDLNVNEGIYWRSHTYSSEAVDYPVFQEFSVGDVSVEELMQYENAYITITAYAVQSADITSVEAAWEMVETKYT